MVYYLLILLGVLLDQISKYFAILKLKGKESIKLIDNLLYLTYAENTGAAWGIFSDAKYFFIIFSFLAILSIIYFIKKYSSEIDSFYKIPLVMIITGAIGNLIDRIRLGYVVDFIFSPLGGLYDFPIFNIADIFISLASMFLIIYLLFFEKRRAD